MFPQTDRAVLLLLHTWFQRYKSVTYQLIGCLVFLVTERLNEIEIEFSLSVCTKTDNYSAADM